MQALKTEVYPEQKKEQSAFDFDLAIHGTITTGYSFVL